VEFSRICPKCKKNIITYKTKGTFVFASKRNSNCKKCSTSWNDFNLKVKFGVLPVPFKGKTHSNKTIKKLKKVHKQRMSDLKNNPIKYEAFKNKMKLVTGGLKNGMYGKKVYDIWIEKYGKEEADKKEIARKEKISKASSGKNNGMYGKPSPQGSGNGWKGWYKGIFFRSLLELSFLINYIERFNFKMENAEKTKYSIKYKDYKGTDRTYFADYIINDKYIVEIKPKNFHKSISNIPKIKAGIKYAKRNKLKYKLIDPIRISEEQIIKRLNNETLIFTKQYKDKVNNYLYGRKNNIAA